jgi:hypothetical protein
MAKTKLVVKEDQILVDAELIFDEIRKAKGDWQKVEQEIKAMLEAFAGN